MKEVTATRNLETVTAEIVTITGQVKCAVVSAAIEIGRRLVEAKELVPHGEWGKYLEEKVSFSPSQAGNMMRLYNEYGSNQESLFGGGAKAIEALSVTSAIRLLSLPAEEREAFVEENDVAAMSTRELERAIKERNEALEAQKAAEASARQSEDAVKTAEAAAAVYQERLAALEKKLDSAKAGEKKAKEALKQLKDNPVLPEDLMAKIRKEAEVTAAEAAAGEAAGVFIFELFGPSPCPVPRTVFFVRDPGRLGKLFAGQMLVHKSVRGQCCEQSCTELCHVHVRR